MTEDHHPGIPTSTSISTSTSPAPEPTSPRGSHRILDPADWQRIRRRLIVSDRELDVIQHIFDGLAEGRIAWLLTISPHTVHTYIKRIYAKLKVSDRRELILRVVEVHLHHLTSAQ